MEIGIPLEGEDDEIMPSWDVLVDGFFDRPGKEAIYVYDFGDDWGHTITLDDILPKEKGTKYPRCIAGERACTPEDCGGVWGYRDLLETLNDPEDPGYAEIMEWLEGQAPDNCPFDPERFNPREVKFDNPTERFDKAFG